jgi:UDP-N-acetylglucosamine--N-acetylmuramyl-(pentapeptide) pyrophosphoryl-undecaprenol N-acetylglucosamine transferase
MLNGVNAKRFRLDVERLACFAPLVEERMASQNTQEKKKKTVIIAGGGTGGHIYPAIAIGRAVEKLRPDIEVHFVGAPGGMEERIVPREKFPLHLVPIGKLHHTVGLATRLKTILKMPLAFVKAVQILRELKPVAVLGVGGFASGPILFVSSLFGYRSLIWEPNAFPGMANRLLSRMVSECLLVFEEASRFLRAKHVTKSGIPVRAAMVPREHHDFAARPLRVLVFGGSQGARAINNVVCESVVGGGDWLSGVELVHQTGSLDFARIREAYKSAPPNVQVLEYLHDMEARYAWADIVVCRAGAATVAEICACEKAAIFVPLPTAADNHQQKNAEVLARANAAVMILQKDFNHASFEATVKRFRDDRSQVRAFESNVRQFQFPQAAEKIVERLLEGV